MFVAITLKAENHLGQEETFVTKTRIFLQKQLSIQGTGFSRCLD
jgi:hypothetical protein